MWKDKQVVTRQFVKTKTERLVSEMGSAFLMLIGMLIIAANYINI